jgi:hypothetical protein
MTGRLSDRKMAETYARAGLCATGYLGQNAALVGILAEFIA